MKYWLFINNDKVAEWGTIESCQSQARLHEGSDLKWTRSEDGPQGNGSHWYAFGCGSHNSRNEYMIVVVSNREISR